MHGGYRRRDRRPVMPVTDQQARALAFIASAVRPHRASTWDEAGIVANIAKVRDRDLAAVALAVIRAASDREAKSPGVIPTNGPHWSERLVEPKWEPNILSRDERCSVCSQREDRCRTLAATDPDPHEFVPASATAGWRSDSTRAKTVTDALRAEVQPTRATTDTAPQEDAMSSTHSPTTGTTEETR